METNKGRAFKMCCLGCIGALTMAGCAHFNKGTGTEAQQAPVAQVQTETQVETAPVDLTETEIKDNQTPDYYVHTVKWHGESLSYIAKWYTGQFRNWKVLATANPTLNPNRIHKGNQIIIPEGVLKTRRPMPKNFMAKLTSQTTSKKTSVKASSEPEEEKAIPLFGPKEHTSN